jgi:hypothetical protein
MTETRKANLPPSDINLASPGSVFRRNVPFAKKLIMTDAAGMKPARDLVMSIESRMTQLYCTVAVEARDGAD